MLSQRVSSIAPSLTLAITAKAKGLKRGGKNVVNFAAGEPDFDTPEFIKDAAARAIAQGATKYTPASGTPELKQAICDKFLKDNGLRYSPENIAVCCGAKHALFNLFQALCNPGDEVLVPLPYWLSYAEMIKIAGGTPVFIEEMKEDFTITEAMLNRYCSPRTRLIVLNSPSNPAGVVYSKDTLEIVRRYACRRNLYVISDEIYEKLLYDGARHISIASLGADIFARTFVVNGVSKSHAMTGWRIGYVAGDREVIKGIAALQSHSTSNPASISQAAALSAITTDAAGLRGMVDEFQARRDIMVKGLTSITKLSPHIPRGAFYCFVDIRRTGMDSMTFSQKLLDEMHVATIPGLPFGMDTHVRMSFATGRAEIEEGITRIKKWLTQ